MSTAVEPGSVLDIAREVFSTMFDGDAGLLAAWDGPVPPLDPQVVAWVDVHGDWSGRAALRTSTPTANDLARGLLGLAPAEEVSRDDLSDAFGELANVVGGNVKALIPNGGKLGLPVVADDLPEMGDAVRFLEIRLAWRTAPFVVEIWSLPAPA